MRPGDAVTAWTSEFPGLVAEARGERVLVRGTVEQHEALERLATGRPLPVADGEPARPAAPRDKRTFTIRQRVTPRALIETLEKSGIDVVYDARRLHAAGVDLDRPVALELKQAPADEFFRAWCDPLRLDFAIDGVTVRLTPR
jgi:hypothetical protein